MKNIESKEGPLLFIKTITEKVEPFQQSTFDSRNKKDDKFYYHNDKFYTKINRIVMMYSRGKPIICKIILSDLEELISIPYTITNEILYCYILDDMDSEINVMNKKELEFSHIKDILIMRI